MKNLKVYLNKPNENWIVDRLVNEWEENNKEITADNLNEANIVWVISPWTYKDIPKENLKNKIVICTIHHIDFEKFTFIEKIKFNLLDRYVDYYHTISNQTENSLKKITKKPIWNNPWWINQNIWYEIVNKEDLKESLGIDKKYFTIGSFQRDTEGKDLNSPKLSKGPDRFIEIVLSFHKDKDIQVILTGTRRQYIIQKLEENNIKYHYFEMTDLNLLNNLYNCLDLYIVSSRVEGGPQAIYECALTKTPIISTDVGVASKFLHEDSIYNMNNFAEAKPNIQHAFNKIQTQVIPAGFQPFVNKFKDSIES